jgi:hypothetical protein
MPIVDARAYAEQLLASLIPQILANNSTCRALHQVLVEFSELWNLLFALDPWNISVATINAMITPDTRNAMYVCRATIGWL